jgi:predicted DsbA family dithiol-disulfide isomerase
MWVSRGINGVPAVVVAGKGLISGGQPAGGLNLSPRA